MKPPRVLSVTVGLAAALCIGGCGGSGGKADGGARDGASDTNDGGPTGDPFVCSNDGGTGTLSVRVTGAPDGGGKVWAAGMLLVQSQDLTVNAGIVDVHASPVAPHGPSIRTAYLPVVDVREPCVWAGETTTVTVTYGVLPSSGKLWLGSATADKAMVGFSPDTLAASGTPAATVAADTAGSGGFAFDQAGNLWVLGATAADPPLARYPASSLGTSGAKTPDVVIDSPSFGTGLPRPQVLALDVQGNLFVAVPSADKVVMFTADWAQRSGTYPAFEEITGVKAPSGLAFSVTNDLFISSTGDGTVVRARGTPLGGSDELIITAMTPAPVIGPLPAPEGLAFDLSGNLWVNFGGTLAKLTRDDLQGTGAKTVTPAVQIATDVLSLPHGIAFDERGGLWLGYTAGKFARLAPTQLAASASVAPEVVIASPDVTSAGWFGFYPAPVLTGLSHRLP